MLICFFSAPFYCNFPLVVPAEVRPDSVLSMPGHGQEEVTVFSRCFATGHLVACFTQLAGPCLIAHKLLEKGSKCSWHQKYSGQLAGFRRAQPLRD